MFKYLITVKPLGLLYGSSGRFLSPENLVGRSGTHFPPSAATVSGLFAHHYGSNEQPKRLHCLQIAGPFWGWQSDPQDFCVPAPMSLLSKFKPNLKKTQIPEAVVEDRLAWHADTDIQWRNSSDEAPDKKFSVGTWVKLSDWDTISKGDIEASKTISIYGEPWQYAPHLHPYLLKDQRKVDTDRKRGSLFLENSVQLHPEACLIYLSNLKLNDGWYRFGGEGHMVEITCDELDNPAKQILDIKIERSFALITPAIWGSNRLSYRYPQELKKGDKQRHELADVDSDLSTQWQVDGLLTKRPSPFRYRLGDANSALEETGKPKRAQPPKRLSRGRYAMPAGSVYVLKTAFSEDHNTWQKWPDAWFPQEGPSLKRWGCGLALPLDSAIAS